MTSKVTPPFRCKQFTVQQSRSAMKVGFDGILLGAWTNVEHCHRILDVGTGTGLIALMLAQRTADYSPPPQIEAVEVDAASIQDATENFQRSNWNRRLQLIHDRFQDWVKKQLIASSIDDPAADQTGYDLVVSNPPYFLEGHVSCNPARARARHGHQLDANELIRAAPTLLNDNGRLSLILPTEGIDEVLQSARELGLCCRRRMSVRALPAKPPHRELLEFRLHDGEFLSTEITIEEQHHVYTDSFRKLCRDFYLAF